MVVPTVLAMTASMRARRSLLGGDAGSLMRAHDSPGAEALPGAFTGGVVRQRIGHALFGVAIAVPVHQLSEPRPGDACPLLPLAPVPHDRSTAEFDRPDLLASGVNLKQDGCPRLRQLRDTHIRVDAQ